MDNQFDYNKCRILFKVDGDVLVQKDYTREGGRAFRYDFKRNLKAGNHEFSLELQPLTPDEKQVRSLTMRLDSVVMRGPDDPKFWSRPKNFDKFFPKDAPADPIQRRVYAAELLTKFATKAFRRPVDRETVNRLTDLAEQVYKAPGKTFEAGIAHAMVAVLASPRFLFREEGLEAPTGPNGFARVDEYALASRLSYFLWSSMPDAELFRLAGAHELRKSLDAQVKRMLADSRSQAFIRNFTGQWLQARDIDSVVIDARSVLLREEKVDPERDRKRARFRELRNKHEDTLTPEEKEEMAKLRTEVIRRFNTPGRAELTGELRNSMRQETEKYFDYVIRENRPLLELLESDYTFLNSDWPAIMESPMSPAMKSAASR